MPVDFDGMIGRALNILGTAATYKAGGVGAGTSITVMPAREDEIVGFGETRVHATDRGRFEVLVSAVASPAQADTLTIGADVFVVKAPPRYADEERLIWLLDCYKQ